MAFSHSATEGTFSVTVFGPLNEMMRSSGRSLSVKPSTRSQGSRFAPLTDGPSGVDGSPQDGGGDARYGVVNLGGRPTFDETERLLETHVLDFSGELYESHLQVCFLEQLRGVQRFSGVEELRAAIERDVAAARILMARIADEELRVKN